MSKPTPNCPTESQEQKTLFEICEIQKHKYPELAMLFHIPNGGKRDAVTAAKLKAEGVKPGVPDLFLPVPRGKYHGLFIELKRQSSGRLSETQRNWCRDLTYQGYAVRVCKGAAAAMRTLEEYICIDGGAQ